MNDLLRIAVTVRKEKIHPITRAHSKRDSITASARLFAPASWRLTLRARVTCCRYGDRRTRGPARAPAEQSRRFSTREINKDVRRGDRAAPAAT